MTTWFDTQQSLVRATEGELRGSLAGTNEELGMGRLSIRKVTGRPGLLITEVTVQVRQQSAILHPAANPNRCRRPPVDRVRGGRTRTQHPITVDGGAASITHFNNSVAATSDKRECSISAVRGLCVASRIASMRCIGWVLEVGRRFTSCVARPADEIRFPSGADRRHGSGSRPILSEYGGNMQSGQEGQ